jgi:hypothetical protein
LLQGDEAQPVPNVSGEVPPSPRPPANPAPRRSRAVSSLPPAWMMEAEPKQKSAPAAPLKPVNQIEVFDGKKKSTVEFPQ